MRTAYKRVNFVSPYLFVLSSFCHIGLLFCVGLTIFFVFSQNETASIALFIKEWWAVFTFLLILYAAFVICIGMDAYTFCGVCYIDGDKISVRAPFRKKITLHYNKIQHIGIDYGIVNGSMQYWIYISTKAISKEYCHKINKLPFSPTSIRLQYSTNIYEMIIAGLPLHLKKSLEKGQPLVKDIN